MRKYDHLRDKARQWRLEGASIDEICARLALSKGTVYPWIKHIPLQRKRKRSDIRTQYFSRLRAEAYSEGEKQFEALAADPSFILFVMLYLTEGTRKTSHHPAISNSNPRLIQLGHSWFKRLTSKPIKYSVQIHADQDEAAVKAFWARLLETDSASIKTSRKSNTGQLAKRRWRSVHGVLMIKVCDTYFRCRLEAWFDKLPQMW